MRKKPELTVIEASKIMGVDAQQVRYGMRNGTLPIGWYTQSKNKRNICVPYSSCKVLQIYENDKRRIARKIKRNTRN